MPYCHTESLALKVEFRGHRKDRLTCKYGLMRANIRRFMLELPDRLNQQRCPPQSHFGVTFRILGLLAIRPMFIPNSAFLGAYLFCVYYWVGGERRAVVSALALRSLFLRNNNGPRHYGNIFGAM